MSTGVTTDMALLQGILDEMEGVLPNDVGAVASYDGSRVRSDAAIKANSLKMSSYNRLGQKVKQWTIYGLEGAPATQASFTYNVSGELSATETAEWKGKSWSTISSLAYYYDDMGRLKSVLESGDSLMRIDRTEAGLFGAEGRGAYAGASAYGLHAEVAQNGGFSWGFQRMFDLVDVDGYEGGGLGRGFSLEETEYVGSLGADFAEGDEFISDVGTHLKEFFPNDFSYVHHFLNGRDWDGALTGFYETVKIKGGGKIEYNGYRSIRDVADDFKLGYTGWDGKSDIRIMKMRFLWKKEYWPMLEPGGEWHKYRNGKRVK